MDARRADAAFALALNLAPPLIGALTISTLRGGAARLLGKPSPVADGVSVVEVTSLMMLLSTSVAAPIALAVEELGALGGNATVVDAIESGALPAIEELILDYIPASDAATEAVYEACPWLYYAMR